MMRAYLHLYDHKDAEGFINLFTLPIKINAMKDEKLKNKQKIKNSVKSQSFLF